MSSLRTRISPRVSPRISPRISREAWTILLLTALGLLIRFGLFRTIAW